jgi:hypothetical protein
MGRATTSPISMASDNYNSIKTTTSYPYTNASVDEPCTFVRDFMVGTNRDSLKDSSIFVAKDEDDIEAHDLDYMKTEHDTEKPNIFVDLTKNAVVKAVETDPNVLYEKKEKVNHPSHYNSVKKETIKILEDYLTDDEYAGFLKGNVLKYIHRYKFKNGTEDLNKAKWYLEELIRFNSKETK